MNPETWLYRLSRVLERHRRSEIGGFDGDRGRADWWRLSQVATVWAAGLYEVRAGEQGEELLGFLPQPVDQDVETRTVDLSAPPRSLTLTLAHFREARPARLAGLATEADSVEARHVPCWCVRRAWRCEPDAMATELLEVLEHADGWRPRDAFEFPRIQPTALPITIPAERATAGDS